ncbi:UDP-glucuronosyltransferase 2B17-like, partial [Aphis craccivora]
RPLSPSKTVDYWTRYVIRHKGAPHLKSHALDLKWSHWNFMSAVLQSLSDNGHNVTVYTPFQAGNRSNYTEINLELPSNVGMGALETLKMFAKPTDMITIVMNMTRHFCNIANEQKDIRELLNSGKSNYDIIITETASSECSSYVASKINLPMIYLVPSPMLTHIEHSVFGDGPNPATVSHLMANHAVPRTFAQRLSNFILLGTSLFAILYKEMELKKIDPQPYDLVKPKKPSLVFMNTHYITDAPRPLPANVIQVGGIHLKSPNSIPNDILEFIENSPHGVIYFTFGSIIAMSTLPDHIQNAFKEALAQVPQRVLWKYEGEMKDKPINDILEFIESSPHGVIYFTFGSMISMSTLPDHIQNAFKEALAQVPQRVLWKYEGEMKDKPINVMTSKWFPQRDILMHPNVKLFISHGGISGVYEAVDAGVPVLGFPLFYDQPRNIENLVDAGMGISMDLLSIQKDELLKNILDLTNNEKYTKNAKITSERFKDRPMTPAELVVYWTEYVVRHKGAPHLKTQAFNLTWYQYVLLDSHWNFNYTEFYLELPSRVGLEALESINSLGQATVIIPLGMNMTRYYCNIIHEQKDMREILRSGKSNYDIIITEHLSSECSSYVASKLNLPLIYVIPSSMNTYMEHTVLGDVSNPSTVSHLLAHHAVPKTFFQRFSNVILLGFSLIALLYKEIELKKIDIQPYDLVKPIKPSLILMNSDSITEGPRPMPPNVIQIGGIHLKTPNSIPNRVLWKFEGEMKDKPINVMTSKWFPQRDLLTVDAGVLVLGFPFFYDQHRNIDNLVEAGIGMSMNLLTIQKDVLLNNILELTNNEKYTNNAKITSERFKDRPMSPVELVVYWTEYVVRHKGAPHLKTQAFNLKYMKNAKIASERFKDRPMSPAELVVYWTEYVVRHKGAPHLKTQAFNLKWYQYILLDVVSVVLITYASVDALQILAIEHIAAKSHWNFMSAVLQSLSENGHNVTVYTPFPVGNQSNYTEISLELPSQIGMDAVDLLNMFEKPTDMIPLIINMTRDFCNIAYEQNEIQELLNSDKSNYDIFITEVLSSECSSYVATKLNLPLIYVIPSPMITYMERSVIGEVSNPATVSHLMSHHAVPRTFYQRLSNVIILSFSLFALLYKEMELKQIDTQPYDLVKPVKPSLVFINTHYITDAPRPLPANLIQVGGIHLKAPNSIPDNILEFIERSPHGVIYFTFGSVISMSTLPDNIQNAFKEAFAQIPQRILWKYEGEMKDKPNNVMTSKWFPQRDLLTHPKVKLFITHGGISGVYEAVDAGVPVLGFPFFYDQHRNIDN